MSHTDSFFHLKNSSMVVNHWADNAGIVNMNSNKQLASGIKGFSEIPCLVSNNALMQEFSLILSEFNNDILYKICRKKSIRGVN